MSECKIRFSSRLQSVAYSSICSSNLSSSSSSSCLNKHETKKKQKKKNVQSASEEEEKKEREKLQKNKKKGTTRKNENRNEKEKNVKVTKEEKNQGKTCNNNSSNRNYNSNKTHSKNESKNHMKKKKINFLKISNKKKEEEEEGDDEESESSDDDEICSNNNKRKEKKLEGERMDVEEEENYDMNNNYDYRTCDDVNDNTHDATSYNEEDVLPMRDVLSLRLSDNSFCLLHLQHVLRNNFLRVMDAKVRFGGGQAGTPTETNSNIKNKEEEKKNNNNKNNNNNDNLIINNKQEYEEQEKEENKVKKGKEKMKNIKADFLIKEKKREIFVNNDEEDDNEKLIEKLKRKIINCMKYKESSLTLLLGSPGSGKTACIEEALRRVAIWTTHSTSSSSAHSCLNNHTCNDKNSKNTNTNNNSRYDKKNIYEIKINDNTANINSLPIKNKQVKNDTNIPSSSSSSSCYINNSNKNNSNNNKEKEKNVQIGTEEKHDIIKISINSELYKDDVSCMKHIVNKVCAHMHCDIHVNKLKASSLQENVDFLHKLLKEVCMYTRKTIVLILDHFEKFCISKRQSLLYTLFDLQHIPSLHICIICVSSILKITEWLEKRVRSRFTPQWIYIKDICSVNLLINYIYKLLHVGYDEVITQFILTKKKRKKKYLQMNTKDKKQEDEEEKKEKGKEKEKEEKNEKQTQQEEHEDITVSDEDKKKIFVLVKSYNFAIFNELKKKHTAELFDFELNNGRSLMSFFIACVECILSFLPTLFTFYENEETNEYINNVHAAKDTLYYNNVNMYNISSNSDNNSYYNYINHIYFYYKNMSISHSSPPPPLPFASSSSSCVQPHGYNMNSLYNNNRNMNEDNNNDNNNIRNEGMYSNSDYSNIHAGGYDDRQSCNTYVNNKHFDGQTCEYTLDTVCGDDEDEKENQIKNSPKKNLKRLRSERGGPETPIRTKRRATETLCTEEKDEEKFLMEKENKRKNANIFEGSSVDISTCTPSKARNADNNNNTNSHTINNTSSNPYDNHLSSYPFSSPLPPLPPSCFSTGPPPPVFSFAFPSPPRPRVNKLLANSPFKSKAKSKNKNMKKGIGEDGGREEEEEEEDADMSNKNDENESDSEYEESKKTEIETLTGGFILSDIHSAYLRRVFTELNEIEHLILSAFCRLHSRQILPKNFAKILEELAVFFSAKNVASNFMQLSLNYSLSYSSMSYRRSYMRLIELGLIEISICQEMQNRNLKIELLNDAFATFLPAKFTHFQMYMDLLQTFRLPTSIENWVRNKIDFTR